MSKNVVSENLMICEHCLSAVESREGALATKTHRVNAENDNASVCDWCDEVGNDVLYELIPELKEG